MLAQINSAALNGLKAISVKVEVNANFANQQGLADPIFTVVGLPDKSVVESRQRVRSAIDFLG